MHVTKLLHNLFRKALPQLHLKRLTAVINATQSLLKGKRLTLTALGRSLEGKGKERHNIRLLDRLLGNKTLHQEVHEFYITSNVWLFSQNKRPLIHVDWSCTNKKKAWHILRASVAIRGRGMTVYQEVHPYKKVNSPTVEKQFLKNLKKVLPPEVVPIMISDAGFRCPWFKSVIHLGWDYVGRVRNKTCYREVSSLTWKYTYDLYKQATAKVSKLTDVRLSKSGKLCCCLVLYKKKTRGRKHINLSGKQTNNTASNRCARSAREPWLLATSLKITTLREAKEVVRYYEKRMQIEEDFRDSKSHQFGFGLRYSRTDDAERLQILLLFAMLAMFACWLVA